MCLCILVSNEIYATSTCTEKIFGISDMISMKRLIQWLEHKQHVCWYHLSQTRIEELSRRIAVSVKQHGSLSTMRRMKLLKICCRSAITLLILRILPSSCNTCRVSRSWKTQLRSSYHIFRIGSRIVLESIVYGCRCRSTISSDMLSRNRVQKCPFLM